MAGHAVKIILTFKGDLMKKEKITEKTEEISQSDPLAILTGQISKLLYDSGMTKGDSLLILELIKYQYVKEFANEYKFKVVKSPD